MTDTVLAQHAPAVKVGGRRLSTSTKHKRTFSSENGAVDKAKSEDSKSDYPRPPAPENGAEVPTQDQEEEEESPKKDKKGHDNERKMQEYAHWKAESTRPTRDLHSGNRGSTMGVRIGQPAGKNLGL